ncbi:hypothetical protein CRG98_013561, partial [Punica granatum]
KKAELVKQIHEEARQNILKKNEQAATRANKGRKRITFQPGDWIWVHLRKERFSNKRNCSDSRTNPFEERGNDTTLGQTDKLRSERLRDEHRGHDDEAEAHELGSWIRKEGVDAQDLGGLHVSSGPITRAKARQIQQAVESSFAGFFGPRGD